MTKSKTVDASNAAIRRATLKPLSRRKISPASKKQLEKALNSLERTACASYLAKELANVQKSAKSPGPKWSDPSSAQAMVDVAMASLIGNRISMQKYVLFVSAAADALTDARHMKGIYPELEVISEEIGIVEKNHGLADGQYWLASDGPDDWRALNEKYSEALEGRFAETLMELGAQDVASLFTKDRKRYDRLRERGRRSIFHRDEHPAALADTILRYEQEARLAASAGAYTAGVMMFGAAVEGVLLLRCLASKKKAIAIAGKLPKPRRPRAPDVLSNWTFDSLIETCLAAGWLPQVETRLTTIRPEALAHLLRDMRNNIHPGRVMEREPWIELEESDFVQADVIYSTIFATVSSRYVKKLKAIAAL